MINFFLQFHQFLCNSQFLFFLTKLLASVVLIALTLLTNSSSLVFLTTLFYTASLSLHKSIGVVFNLPISNLTNLSKLPKSTFSAKSDLSTPFVFFKSAFVA